MIPFGDINPTRRTPVVNYALLIINVLVFGYELLLGLRLDNFIEDWAVRPIQVTTLLSGEWSLLVPVLISATASMFLHGGWMHIISNMLFLWIFGDNVEDNFGSLAYLAFYLLCGYGAVLGQTWLEPRSPVAMIGASGAISGVLAAYLLLYPRASIRALLPILFFIPLLVPAWIIIIIWFVGQLLNGLAALTDTAMMTGGVAYGAHVGGFLVGLVLLFLFRKPQRPPRYQRYQRV